MTQESVPQFNNLTEQKAYALQKTDQLIKEIDETIARFDSPEEIQRLTEVLAKAKAVCSVQTLEEFVAASTKDKFNATNEYKFLYNVSVFDTVEAYIADLKEKAENTKQTFIMLRQSLINTKV